MRSMAFRSRCWTTKCALHGPLTRLQVFRDKGLGYPFVTTKRNMWLINASTRQLEHFMDDRQIAGQYAILSHTWGSEEVTFDDYQTGASRSKQGYQKIDSACNQAVSEGLKYVWADTCCIDKRSSAELSEAINSMYRWYRDARICYAYLEDLTEEQSTSPVLGDSEGFIGSSCSSNILFDGFASHLAKCRWFTRGWTLQELIAPREVVFFNQAWNAVATRSSISEVLSTITNIDHDVLVDRRMLYRASVAKRMSWAAKRTTLRLEDQAYSLLGIFGINMPLLYGEGWNAFKRLQEEIMRNWERVDHSILIRNKQQSGQAALLARTVLQFSDGRASNDRPSARDIISWSPPQNQTFSLTNKGLRISLFARAIALHESGIRYLDWESADHDRLIVALNCSYASAQDKLIGLYLRRRPSVYPVGLDQAQTGHEQDFAMYDFDSDFRTVKISELQAFTFTTLTIARFPHPKWATEPKVRVSWPSWCSVHELSPAQEWDASTGTVDFSGPWSGLHKTASVAFKTFGSTTETDFVLEFGMMGPSLHLLTTGDQGFHEPSLRVRLRRRPRPAGAFKATHILKHGGHNTFEIDGEPFLSVSAKYSLANGKIIWNLVISDPT